MKIIYLTQNKIAVVDDEDFKKLNQFKWCYVENKAGYGYARRSITIDKKKSNILMHREILNVPGGVLTDHENHNTLDNRRKNIRQCTRSQNGANRIKGSGSSKFKGVYWHARWGHWMAHVQTKGKPNYRGPFLKEEDAARAYDEMAIECFGEFARLNFRNI